MNNELDIDNLKKSWKEQDNSQNKYSQEELIQMLNKKSSNNVKYIVIISIIEFILLMVSLFFTSIDSDTIVRNLDSHAREIYLRNYKISQVLVYINIFISLGFIFFFYKSYRKINVMNSTKNLINNILNFRKSVNWFIFINITLGLTSFFLTGFYDFMSGFKKGIDSTTQNTLHIEKIHTPLSSPEYIFWFILVCVISIVIILLYYFLIYGILLRRLKKNLKELQKYEG